MTAVLMRERGGRFEIWRHRGECHVKMEAEIAMMLPQAKTCLEPPEVGRGKGEFFPRAFGGSVVLLHLDFLTPDSTTVR